MDSLFLFKFVSSEFLFFLTNKKFILRLDGTIGKDRGKEREREREGRKESERLRPTG